MKKVIFVLSCMLITTFILVSFVSAQAWPSNLNDGLVYYFKLDETSGNTIEHVANRVSGVVEGATQGVPGLINKSYSFDGVDDRVNFGDVTEVEGIPELTISAWVKTPIGRGDNDIIVINGGPLALSFIMVTRIDGSVSFSVPGVSSYCYTRNTISIADNQWHLLTGVYDATSNNVVLYLDGVLGATTWPGSTCTENIITNNQELLFGALPTGNRFQGSIDEVGFWTRALTENEITQLYNNGNGLTYLGVGGCTDNDADGYYANCSPYDCNDNNAQINPDLIPCKEFQCNDRIDNDLDGFIDKADQDCSQLQCVLPTFQKAEEP